MEFIIISNDKLKIILDENDMREYKIDPDRFDNTTVESKYYLKKILDEARNATGFDSSHKKLFIQMFTSIKGGCEIFITEIEKQSSEQIQNKPHHNQEAITEIYYISLDFDTLCRLCLRIKNDTKKYFTMLYYDNISKYYLIFNHKYIHVNKLTNGSLKNIYPDYLHEYGDVSVGNSSLLDSLNEHYKIITSENAIEIIYDILTQK